MTIPDKLPQPTVAKHFACKCSTLENKLHARINQRDTANCCVMAFTETWLDPTDPDWAIASAGFSIYQKERTRESSKHRGEGYALWLTLAEARM